METKDGGQPQHVHVKTPGDLQIAWLNLVREGSLVMANYQTSNRFVAGTFQEICMAFFEQYKIIYESPNSAVFEKNLQNFSDLVDKIKTL